MDEGLAGRGATHDRGHPGPARSRPCSSSTTCAHAGPAGAPSSSCTWWSRAERRSRRRTRSAIGSSSRSRTRSPTPRSPSTSSRRARPAGSIRPLVERRRRLDETFAPAAARGLPRPAGAAARAAVAALRRRPSSGSRTANRKARSPARSRPRASCRWVANQASGTRRAKPGSSRRRRFQPRRHSRGAGERLAPAGKARGDLAPAERERGRRASLRPRRRAARARRSLPAARARRRRPLASRRRRRDGPGRRGPRICSSRRGASSSGKLQPEPSKPPASGSPRRVKPRPRATRSSGVVSASGGGAAGGATSSASVRSDQGRRSTSTRSLRTPVTRAGRIAGGPGLARPFATVELGDRAQGRGAPDLDPAVPAAGLAQPRDQARALLGLLEGQQRGARVAEIEQRERLGRGRSRARGVGLERVGDRRRRETVGEGGGALEQVARRRSRRARSAAGGRRSPGSPGAGSGGRPRGRGPGSGAASARPDGPSRRARRRAARRRNPRVRRRSAVQRWAGTSQRRSEASGRRATPTPRSQRKSDARTASGKATLNSVAGRAPVDLDLGLEVAGAGVEPPGLDDPRRLDARARRAARRAAARSRSTANETSRGATCARRRRGVAPLDLPGRKAERAVGQQLEAQRRREQLAVERGGRARRPGCRRRRSAPRAGRWRASARRRRRSPRAPARAPRRRSRARCGRGSRRSPAARAPISTRRRPPRAASSWQTSGRRSASNAANGSSAGVGGELEGDRLVAPGTERVEQQEGTGAGAVETRRDRAERIEQDLGQLVGGDRLVVPRDPIGGRNRGSGQVVVHLVSEEAGPGALEAGGGVAAAAAGGERGRGLGGPRQPLVGPIPALERGARRVAAAGVEVEQQVALINRQRGALGRRGLEIDALGGADRDLDRGRRPHRALELGHGCRRRAPRPGRRPRSRSSGAPAGRREPGRRSAPPAPDRPPAPAPARLRTRPDRAPPAAPSRRRLARCRTRRGRRRRSAPGRPLRSFWVEKPTMPQCTASVGSEAGKPKQSGSNRSRPAPAELALEPAAAVEDLAHDRLRRRQVRVEGLERAAGGAPAPLRDPRPHPLEALGPELLEELVAVGALEREDVAREALEQSSRWRRPSRAGSAPRCRARSSATGCRGGRAGRRGDAGGPRVPPHRGPGAGAGRGFGGGHGESDSSRGGAAALPRRC